MWLIGILLLIAATVTIAIRAGWRQAPPLPEIWDIPGTARTYTTIVGTLAGFSVTSSIFVANLSVARQSTNFEGVMALFLVAFLVFVSSAMQFGTTPNLATAQSGFYRAIQGYSYLLANASFYLGLCLSWLGLPLLLSAIGLEYLSDIFIWLVLFAILGGAMRISSSGLNIFTGMALLPAIVLPLACFVIACAYRFAASEIWSELLPDEHAPVLFAVVCFGVGAFGFSLQSLLVGSLRGVQGNESVSPLARRFVIALSAAVFTSVSLLWLAVAGEL